MWDIIQGVNSSSPPQSPPHPSGLDEILWLALEDESHSHAEFRDDTVYWANVWGGPSYWTWFRQRFIEHGIPSKSGNYAPPDLSALRKSIPQVEHVPRFSLRQNYPNPFNPDTWIPYTLAEDVTTTIDIYNIQGVRVRRLYLGNQKAGPYILQGKAAYWDGCNENDEYVASGVYFYRLKAGDFIQVKKLILLK